MKKTVEGIMAVFGAPAALEDHAVRACLAVLGVQEETKRLAVDVHAHDGVDPQLRVGLNSGQVIAREIGLGALGYTAVGEQVGMAARMESVAPAARRWVGSTGFATGLGGLAGLPVAVPTDVTVFYMLSGRMSAAIAILRGYDINSEEVQGAVLLFNGQCRLFLS